MKYSISGQQACEDNGNKDHFANNQWRSLLQITVQKCVRNVKKPIRTSDMALLLTELVESFTIAIYHP